MGGSVWGSGKGGHIYLIKKSVASKLFLPSRCFTPQAKHDGWKTLMSWLKIEDIRYRLQHLKGKFQKAWKMITDHWMKYFTTASLCLFFFSSSSSVITYLAQVLDDTIHWQWPGPGFICCELHVLPCVLHVLPFGLIHAVYISLSFLL